MAGVRSIIVRFQGDTDGLRRATEQANRDVKGFGDRAKGLAKGAGIGVAALGGAAVAAVAALRGPINAASDLAEAQSKVGALFGDQSRRLTAFASDAADNYGMSEKAALGYVGSVGAVLRAQGQSEKAAADQSLALTKLAADLGSFNNLETGDVLERLTAAQTGEYESLKALGIVINDVALKREGALKGLKGAPSTWDANTKAMVANSIIMKSTKQAQGDFARTSSGLANQQRILAANLDNVKTVIGQKLLPIATKLTGWFITLAKGAQSGEGRMARFKEILTQVGQWISLNLVPAIQRFAVFVKEDLIPTVVRLAKLFWENIKPAVLSLATTVKTQLLPGLLKLWASFQRARPQLEFVLGIVAKLAGFILRNVVPVVIKVAGVILGRLLPAIGQLIEGVAKAIAGFRRFVNFIKGIPSAISGLVRDLRQFGLDFIQGFIDGILEKAKSIPGVIKDGVVGVAKKALHLGGLFGSPSRLTQRYGVWWTEGFVKGIKLTGPRLEQANQMLMDGLRAKVDAAKDIASGIKSAFSLDLSATEVDEKGKKGPSIFDRLKLQAEQAEAFAKQMTKLRKAGLRDTIVKDLLSQGPSALAAAMELGTDVQGANRLANRITGSGTTLGNFEAQRQSGINLAAPNVYVSVTLDGKEMKALASAEVDERNRKLKAAAKAKGKKVAVS